MSPHYAPTAERLAPGTQKPRIESSPEAFGTFGPVVIDFLGNCGLEYDPWQRYAFDSLFAVDEQGLWVASEWGMLLARQNGKGEVLVGYDLAHLYLFPRPDNRRKTVLHTAHEFKTAMDAFQRLEGVVRSRGQLMDRLKKDRSNGIKSGAMEQGITMATRPGQVNGDRIRFMSRTRNAARGFAGDNLIYDEAQELASRARDALTYTQTNAWNRQEVFTGTVPSEENEYEVFEGVRDRGRAHAKRTGWMEWTPEHSENPKALVSHPRVPIARMDGDGGERIIIDLSSEQVWRDSNPAVNIRAFDFDRIAEEVERATDIEALARERFSIWPNRPEAVAEVFNDLDMGAWDHLKGEEYRVADPEVIAVALGRGGGYASVAVASRWDLDMIAVEHKDTQRGILWAPEYVQALKRDNPDALVVVDPKNAAAILVTLDALKVKYLAMNLNEVAAAHDGFIQRVNVGLIGHPDQQEVTRSLETAIPRNLGPSGFTWDASDPKRPVSLAQAVTWAVFGVTKRESTPPRKPAEIRGYA